MPLDIKTIDELVKSAKKVLVLGAGQTGQTAAVVFKQAKLSVSVMDEGDVSAEILEELRSFDIAVRANVDTDEYELDDYEGFDFILASPGIPETSKLYCQARESKAPFVSELDLYYTLIGKPGVAITGTNGKTTVSHIVHKMLSASKKRSTLLGNVGRAASSVLVRPLICPGLPRSAETNDVIEVSSYQLIQNQVFAPKIGVLLNIMPDHLERHGDMEGYLAAKKSMFSFQGNEDFVVLNKDDSMVSSIAGDLNANIFYFGLAPSDGKLGCFYDSEKNLAILQLSEDRTVEFSLEESDLIGLHNKLNLTASILAASLQGAEESAIQSVIDEFTSLPHRIELVRTRESVKYFNDSKATNPTSTVTAIKTIKSEVDGAIALLLGGKVKKSDWTELLEQIDERIFYVICFGPDCEELVNVLCSVDNKIESKLKQYQDLESAVQGLSKLDLTNGAVLLSPACASFDSYKNFEERGSHFRKLVNDF